MQHLPHGYTTTTPQTNMQTAGSSTKTTKTTAPNGGKGTGVPTRYISPIYYDTTSYGIRLGREQVRVVRDRDAEVSTPPLELHDRPCVEHNVLLVGVLDYSSNVGVLR